MQQNVDVDKCVEHLKQAVGAVKQLLDGLATAKRSTAGDTMQGAPESEQLQQAYLQHTQALREGLAMLFQCREEQEQAAATAPQPSSQELEVLRARKEALEQRIRECCQVEKALIDQSRSLLDAMACWDATQKQLA